jgi:hypothetical protein
MNHDLRDLKRMIMSYLKDAGNIFLEEASGGTDRPR